ncbi:hypothetical protein H0H87_005804 [Tephrocybe sp. NHM501043]|nr:hypothetical protein H0H87_005804 [Tephrocybe sp. NHM501043]
MAPATQDVHESRIKLPGFGLRLDYNLGNGHQLFINALDNEDLGSGRAQWMEEALSENVDITNVMINWCISRTSVQDQRISQDGGRQCLVKSDCAMPKDLQEALKAAVALLEQVPDHLKDWHPGSDNLVLDLVHPSLFPLIYGRTRILPDDTIGLKDCVKRSGEGIVVPVPPESENGIKDQTLKHSWQRSKPTAPFSRKFQ